MFVHQQVVIPDVTHPSPISVSRLLSLCLSDKPSWPLQSEWCPVSCCSCDPEEARLPVWESKPGYYSSVLDLVLCPPLTSSSGGSAGSASMGVLTPFTHHQAWFLSSPQLNDLHLSRWEGESTWRAGNWPEQRVSTLIPIKGERRRESRGER